MDLSSNQQLMLDEAQTWVRQFIRKRGGFARFALVKHVDGKIGLVQPSAEFPDAQSELTETLRVLVAMAKNGQIDACVLCTPTEMSGSKFAVLDVETRTDGR